MSVILNVDGWLFRVPEGTAFIGFRSSDQPVSAGHHTAYDGDGNELEREPLGLVPDANHWTQRVPIT
jgi:hypothetical protein